MLNGYQPNDSSKPPKYLNGDTNAEHIRNLDAWSTLEAFKTGVQSFDYQSPIEIIYNQIQCDIDKQLEKNVIQAVQSYGINVDRDELIKALQYNRKQYEKGFEDAKKQFERPQGDLLSRDALIKWIDDSVSKYGHIYSTDTLNMWGLFKDYLINFAPTVEPFEPDYVGVERLKARQREYEEGYHNGMEIGKTLNPKIKQGEWLKNANELYKCSLCGAYGNPNYFRFCPNCGSQMVGGSEDGKE